ncbi:OmpA family protein [uncultured Croceitalea sp.]|uniref:OmpA family protein n=1 Tax=uncultured Croceitalea sp. TaxID=1798908 RepID=UPI0033060DCA
MKTILTTILIFLSCLLLIGQDKMKSADKSFFNLHYVKAAKQYEALLNKGNESKELLQRVGDAYYYNTDMENAVQWYGQLFSKYENSLDPKYVFRYIHALQGVGNNRLAKGLMKIYPSIHNTAEFKVEQLQDNDAKLDAILAQQPQFYISNLSINTVFADFGTAFYKDKIVFASSRDSMNLHTRLYEWNQQPYLDFFMGDTISLGDDLVEVNSFSNIINTKYHEGIAAFIPEGNVMYFTRNNYTDKTLERDDDGMNHLKLYKSKLQGGEWTKPEEVAFNSKNYSVGQPALSPDGKHLYFVSDMPGSIGETDIFVIEILKDGSYSQPKNLGPTINTSGREMFPFITEEKIYFASDGHLGLGGLDIFESSYDNGFSAPINLGKPVNSNKDDFAYTVNEATRKGYFSSNRDNGKGDDDIYSFTRLAQKCEQYVKGTVVRKANAIPVSDVIVNLVLDKTIIATTTTDPYGAFSFTEILECELVYELQISKTGFYSDKKAFTTTDEADFINMVPLEMKKERNKLIVEENGVLKIKIDNIYFDLNKADIRPDAAQELNKIVEVMKEYPKMVIKIEAHTDSRGSDQYNEKLSNRRAKSTGNYIVSQGIESIRIKSAIGYGEKQILNRCINGVKCSNEEHNTNRRSEFIIVEIE